MKGATVWHKTELSQLSLKSFLIQYDFWPKTNQYGEWKRLTRIGE
jgi:hypothetical protein